MLVNGPGTCIPICASAWLARLLGVAGGRVVYVESIARVYRLSLSGGRGCSPLKPGLFAGGRAAVGAVWVVLGGCCWRVPLGRCRWAGVTGVLADWQVGCLLQVSGVLACD